MKKKSMVKTKKLCSYMKKRSKVEGLVWGLKKVELDIWFDNGVRNFFGVIMDDNGNLLNDTQEPYLGFFVKENLKDLFNI